MITSYIKYYTQCINIIFMGIALRKFKIIASLFHLVFQVQEFVYHTCLEYFWLFSLVFQSIAQFLRGVFYCQSLVSHFCSSEFQDHILFFVTYWIESINTSFLYSIPVSYLYIFKFLTPTLPFLFIHLQFPL